MADLRFTSSVSKVCGEHSYNVNIQICIFWVSSCFCVVGNHLVIVLNCVLYYLMVISGEIKQINTMFECVSGYKMLRVGMVIDGKLKYEGD